MCGEIEGTMGEGGAPAALSGGSVLREREGERRRAGLREGEGEGEKGTVAGWSIFICVSA